jgi:hypothetical protein
MMGQVVSDSELNFYWSFLDINKGDLILKTELAFLVDLLQTPELSFVSLLSKGKKNLLILTITFGSMTPTETINFIRRRYYQLQNRWV